MNERTDPLIGTEIDGYRVLEIVGRGGMGVVYKAVDVALDRFVALKMIDSRLAYDEAFLRRFRSEGRGLARTNSPFIVQIHALRQSSGRLFIVMEYVEGDTLADRVVRGRMPWREAVGYLRQVLHALEHAHGAGVIHRDIKPRNIMLTQDGAVKVTDFGLAKVHEASAESTMTQGVAGTLYYMAPEQVKATGEVDHRCDLYALGMSAYEMLAGELPFTKGESQYRIMQSIVEQDAPPLDKVCPGLPPGLAGVVSKALEKDPARRFQSAREMREALDAAVGGAAGGDAPPAGSAAGSSAAPAGAGRRWGVAALGVAALAALGTILYLLLRGGGAAEEPPRLFVRSDPGGAVVRVNGDSVGTTPLVGRELASGPVQVSLYRAGYRARDTLLTASEGQRLDLSVVLAPLDTTTAEGRTARLVIRAPRDASVYVDGRLAGRGTVTSTLEPGRYAVEVRQAGFRTWRETVGLAAGEERAPTVRLVREEETSTTPATTPTTTPATTPDQPPARQAALTVRTQGAGTVQVDGRSVAPDRAVSLGAGEHVVTCLHEASGRRAEKRVTLSPGAAQDETCYFSGRVVITLEDGPFSAYYYIDEERRDPVVLGTPVALSVPPGVYRFSVRKSGFQSAEGVRTVEVTPAFEERRYELTFTLRQE